MFIPFYTLKNKFYSTNKLHCWSITELENKFLKLNLLFGLTQWLAPLKPSWSSAALSARYALAFVIAHVLLTWPDHSVLINRRRTAVHRRPRSQSPMPAEEEHAVTRDNVLDLATESFLFWFFPRSRAKQWQIPTGTPRRRSRAWLIRWTDRHALNVYPFLSDRKEREDCGGQVGNDRPNVRRVGVKEDFRPSRSQNLRDFTFKL